MLVIGSQAAKHWFPDWREPVDVDVIGSRQEMEQFVSLVGAGNIRDLGPHKIHIYTGDVNVEWEWYEPDSWTTAMTLDLAYGSDNQLEPWARRLWGGSKVSFAPPGVLLMLKLSHRYLKDSPHFWKTMGDIHLLRKKGAEVPQSLELVLAHREAETYDYAHPNLDRTKDEFFADDSITYYYDHDSVHRAVALDGEPAYRQYLKPGADVAVDMDVFFRLPYDVQLNGVVEEAAVLALERSLIPFWLTKGNTEEARGAHEQAAFQMALMKVCSSITSGRFREFAWENAYEAQARFVTRFHGDSSLVSRFVDGVANGTIIELEAS